MMWNDRLRWRWLGIAVFSFCHLLCFSEVKAETIATVAGNGEPTFFGDWDDAVVASLFNPSDIFVDGDGTLYIAGIITTFAGIGNPSGVGSPKPALDTFRTDDFGNWILDAPDFSDREDQEMHRLTKSTATDSSLSSPRGLWGDAHGNIYVAESSRIRRIDSNGIMTTVAGRGNAVPGDGEHALQANLSLLGYGLYVSDRGDIYFAQAFPGRISKVVGLPDVISLSAPAATMTAGGSGITLTAEIRDRDGNLRTGDNATVVSFDIADGVGEVTRVQAAVVGGIATTTLRTTEVDRVIVLATGPHRAKRVHCH